MRRFTPGVIRSLALTVALTLGLTAASAFAIWAQEAPAPQVPGYMIANYQIHDPAGFQAYLQAAGTLVAQYGGQVIVFNLQARAVEGHPKSVIAIARFPSLAAAQRFYDSPEYRAARPLRIAATEGSVILTEGLAQN